ncbi:MAG: DNA polymerase III subunit gamma/tau [Proteobacteria bacterium]|nr:DNA polymerase III subunit gamma/tau [Pseudomonadota bacterium]
MSYQVLARKWRPKIFREMVGQEHVLRALINALDHDRLHHAYLFTGTRGVGKTTIARILAKCLNCESGVSSEPCGQCSSCVEIAEGRSLDLIEVDAASRTKVEDTRELLDNVQYAPTHSRYKVYLIDEVHMLSGHSFNALLKTLEEPPPHVKFLFATTDPQKLPATILSRCLQFNLKNMPPQQVVGHLQHVLQQEMVSFEEPALWLLGRAADGSMRDALSLTDQAIAFGSGQVNEDDVRTMLGSIDLSYVYQILEAIAGGEPAAVLAVVQGMAEHAPDFEGSLQELISMIHRVAVAQVVPEAIDNSWGDAERIAKIAASVSAEDTQLYYQVAINGKRDMAYAADPRSGFEMILLRMIAFRPAAVLDESLAPGDVQPVATLEKQNVAQEVDSGVKKSREAPAAEQPAQALPVSRPIVKTQVKIAPEIKPAVTKCEASVQVLREDGESNAEVQSPKNGFQLDVLSTQNWPLLLEELGLRGIVYNIASHCELRSCVGSELEFVLDENNASLFNEKHGSRIATVLQNYFDTKLSVTVACGEPLAETPAMQKTRLTAERQSEAVRAIESDTQLQQLIEHFDGELVHSSIAPFEPGS